MAQDDTNRILNRYAETGDPHFEYWSGQVEMMFVPPRLRPVVALNNVPGNAYADAYSALPAEEKELISDALAGAVQAVDAILVRIREEMRQRGTPDEMLAIKVAEQIRHGRLRVPRWCERCERLLEPGVRGDARYCSTACRVAAHRERN